MNPYGKHRSRLLRRAVSSFNTEAFWRPTRLAQQVHILSTTGGRPKKALPHTLEKRLFEGVKR